ETGLVIKTIYVDGARVLKRMRPAPQGRGYRVRKRSNHVTVIVDSLGAKAPKAVEPVVAEEEVKKPAKKAAPKKKTATDKK
ncbi:MAG TPA: uL22 family ribosomal protein, partial [Ferruginibacter sp.]|nr:uL22 family ribosomal protein [Ferruginibacter sp.]